MRAALALAGLLGASQPAVAGDLPTILRTLPLRDASRVQPIIGQALRRDLALRVQVGQDSTPLIGGDSRIQPRIAKAMFDFYPDGGIGGFHISAGLHYYSRYNANLEAQRATDGKLYIPRGRTGAGIRTGFNRYTPAATMGFSQPLGHDAMIGVEGGALVGRALNAQPLRNTGNIGETRAGINPVANLVLGLRF
jgi:hypothetical protein